jgi:hypothetical protein
MCGVVPLGYKTGNSLRCWRDYFINAKIFGIDIFEVNIDEKNIKTFKADQSNIFELEKIMKLINTDIDIIIDDGSHNPEHQVKSFIFLEKYLSNIGIYVIEDIQPYCIEKFLNLSIFDYDYKNYILSKYNIKFFDTRKTNNRDDDFMVAFIKK